MNKGTTPILVRIFRRVETRSNGCWQWTGATYLGYGVVGRGRRGEGTIQVHRAVYQLLVGPIPDGLQLDHLCRNRACCNPKHLEAVTRRENILRGNGASAIHARKTHCAYGHAFDEPNTYVNELGRRTCRACHRRRNSRKPRTAA